MMRDQIIATAREYIGTKFQHQARVKGVAVDCIGLLVGVARELGLFFHDCKDYSRFPDGEQLMAELRRVFQEINVTDAQPGDVLVFWVSRHTRHPQHVGILSEFNGMNYLIHTYAEIGKVTEHVLNDKWRHRIVAAFRFPGVT